MQPQKKNNPNNKKSFIGKFARLHYMVVNANNFPDALIDKIETEYYDILSNPDAMKKIFETGLFRQNEKEIIEATDEGYELGRQEAEASAQYVQKRKESAAQFKRKNVTAESICRMLDRQVKNPDDNRFYQMLDEVAETHEAQLIEALSVWLEYKGAAERVEQN